jgi:hypothetical protein
MPAGEHRFKEGNRGSPNTLTLENMETAMWKSSVIALFVPFALLAGCGGPSSGSVSVAAGDYYDGYYDGFYGPFNDGYWGGDGFFWYSDAGHRLHRDDGRHFRRVAATGFNHVRGTGMQREH